MSEHYEIRPDEPVHIPAFVPSCAVCRWRVASVQQRRNICQAEPPKVICTPGQDGLGRPAISVQSLFPPVEDDWHCGRFERR